MSPTRSVEAGGLDQVDARSARDSPLPDVVDVNYAAGDDREQTLDIYLPESSGAERPAIVFVHAGGFRRGTKGVFRLEGDLARQRGWVGFAVNYRLTEEPGHPAEVNDVLTAIEWIRAHADDYGVDPTRIALYGMSAGGNLAALAAAMPAGPLSSGNRVVAAVSFSGPMDLTAVHQDGRNADTVEAYLGCDPAECPELYADASATTHVTPDDPAMFLAHSAEEGVPVSVAEDLAELLDADGVPVELVIVPGRRHARNLSLETPGLLDQAWSFLAARFDAAEGVEPPSGDIAPSSEQQGGEIAVGPADSTAPDTTEPGDSAAAADTSEPGDSAAAADTTEPGDSAAAADTTEPGDSGAVGASSESAGTAAAETDALELADETTSGISPAIWVALTAGGIGAGILAFTVAARRRRTV